MSERPADVFSRPITDLPMPTRAVFASNRLYARVFHRVRLLTPCPLPKAGGAAIVICNHTASIDPFILQATCPRFLTWMIAKEFYDLPVLGKIARHFGYIPVARNGRDSASLKSALRSLAAGRVLGVFPEGRISATQAMMPLQRGVALLAAKSDVPIYPAFIRGMRLNMTTIGGFVEPQSVTVAYGAPFVASRDLKEATEQMRLAFVALAGQSLAADLPLRQNAPKTKGGASICGWLMIVINRFATEMLKVLEGDGRSVGCKA